jgi:hypothetical protein
MVEFHSLSRHAHSGKCVVGIRKIGKFKSHFRAPFLKAALCRTNGG